MLWDLPDADGRDLNPDKKDLFGCNSRCRDRVKVRVKFQAIVTDRVTVRIMICVRFRVRVRVGFGLHSVFSLGLTGAILNLELRQWVTEAAQAPQPWPLA